MNKSKNDNDFTGNLIKGSALVVTAAGRLFEAVPGAGRDPFGRVHVMGMKGRKGRGWKKWMNGTSIL